jgi:hypothetical protein
MATNKDLKELLEARKARRAIPQVDPADVVVQPPEPELAGPPPSALEASAAVAAQQERAGVAAQPETEPTESTHQPAGPVVVLEAEDPRTQPVPSDDPYIPKTLRVRRHHDRQLRAEAYHRGMLMQNILETALDEYFKKRYGRQGRGHSQRQLNN